MKRKVLYVAAVCAALTVAASAHAGVSWQDMTTAQRTAFVKEAVRHDRNVLRWWSNHRHRPTVNVLNRDTLATLITGRPRWPTCDAIDARVPAPVCGAATRLPREEAALEQLRATFPETGDWMTAVSIVQRAYPGSAQWITDCSSSEGGHGVFVFHGGRPATAYEIENQVEYRTPGGWMQFFPGTFWGDFNSAARDLAARGFRLPRSAWSWYSPLGQAAAAGWAYVDGNHSGSKWTGARCS